MHQAYEMQDFAFETAQALREQLKRDGRVLAPDKEQAAIIGTLGKVWKDAQEQIRIHRGKPLPGSLTHEKVSTRRAKRATLLSVMAEQVSVDAPSDANAQGAATLGDNVSGEMR